MKKILILEDNLTTLKNLTKIVPDLDERNAVFSFCELKDAYQCAMVIRQIEIEILQKAMQSLTEVQKERLHLYFFKGMTTREIADKLGVSQNVVWKSIRGSINTLKKFFE